jgi:uncharacterized protein YhbP (UPF0306 family)
MFDERFVRFIGRHHVMTLATVGGGGMPYCANLFYAFDEEAGVFVFTSDDRTRHYGEMLSAGFAAASIVLETKNVGKIQGLQLQGKVYLPEGEELARARKRYLKRFPYAAAAELTLWILRPTFMKLTDNVLGFGKKLIWNIDSQNS